MVNNMSVEKENKLQNRKQRFDSGAKYSKYGSKTTII